MENMRESSTNHKHEKKPIPNVMKPILQSVGFESTSCTNQHIEFEMVNLPVLFYR
jgi:hypothetical protein